MPSTKSGLLIKDGEGIQIIYRGILPTSFGVDWTSTQTKVFPSRLANHWQTCCGNPECENREIPTEIAPNLPPAFRTITPFYLASKHPLSLGILILF